MTSEERRDMERLLTDAMAFLSDEKQEAILHLANHLAQHKLIRAAWVGEETNPEPCCGLVHLN